MKDRGLPVEWTRVDLGLGLSRIRTSLEVAGVMEWSTLERSYRQQDDDANDASSPYQFPRDRYRT